MQERPYASKSRLILSNMVLTNSNQSFSGIHDLNLTFSMKASLFEKVHYMQWPI